MSHSGATSLGLAALGLSPAMWLPGTACLCSLRGLVSATHCCHLGNSTVLFLLKLKQLTQFLFHFFKNNHNKPAMLTHIHNLTIEGLSQEACCKFQASMDHSMRLKQRNRPWPMFITVRDTKAGRWEGQLLLSMTSDSGAH